MQSCDHEEADTRMFIHQQDALANGSTTCLVHTVDTDVVNIITGKFHALLANYPAADIWIAFGTGKNFMHIHINTICNDLGRDNLCHFQFSTALLAVIQPQLFLRKGRNQHGMPGKLTQS